MLRGEALLLNRAVPRCRCNLPERAHKHRVVPLQPLSKARQTPPNLGALRGDQTKLAGPEPPHSSGGCMSHTVSLTPSCFRISTEDHREAAPRTILFP